MTTSATPQLSNDLRAHLEVCGELMTLAIDENKALQQTGEYQPFEHFQRRKSLLTKLNQSLNTLRNWGAARQKSIQPESPDAELKHLFGAAQDLIVKVLMLDRENQQALLRRGLVPASHVASIPVQRPHFVANLYQRNACTPTA